LAFSPLYVEGCWALLKALMPIMDVPSSNHDFMVDLCSMKVQIFMQKFCPSSSMELHLLENPRIIFLWMNIHGTRMILIQKEK